MRYRARLLMGVVLAAGLLAAHLRADNSPTTKPDDKPLPAKARTPLDKLKPAVSKPASADSEVPRRARKAVEKARKLIEEGQNALAVPLLVERALGFAPNSAEVHRLLAEAYINLPDAGKALVHMRKALAIDGDNIRSQVKLAQLMIAQKQNAQAIVALRTALKCSKSKPENPMTGEALFRLGKLLEREGFLTAALDCFETLGGNIDSHARRYASRPILRNIVLRPQRLLARRGELLARLGRAKEAAPLLKRAYSRDRTNAKLAVLIVESLTATKQFKEAEKFLVELAAQPLLKSKLPELASKTAIASGDKAMPMRIWRACRDAKRDSGALAVSLAGAADKLGAPDKGSEILAAALDGAPGDAVVTRFIIKMYGSQGKNDKVLESLARLLVADPSRDDVVAIQMKAMIRRGVAKDFARKFADKIASAPKDQQAALHYITGRLALAQGDEALASAQWTKAIEVGPAFLPTYARLAGVYAEKDQKDKIADLLKRIEKLPGGQESVAYYYARGKVLAAMSKVAEAEDALKNGLRVDRRHLPTLEALGDLYLVLGRARDAAIAFRAAAKLAPEDRKINKRLFDAYMSLRAYRDARRLADQAVQRDPNSSDAKIMLAGVLVASGAHDEAAKLLAELKKKFADDPRVALMAVRTEIALGGSVMFKKDFDRAAGALDKIIKADESNNAALFELARLMMRNGQYATADKLWEKVLKTRKDDVVRRAGIETKMALEKYAPAAEAIRGMLTILPNDPLLRNRLVTCLRLDGKPDQAYKVMKQWLAQATDAESAVALRFKIINALRTAKLYDQAQEFMDDWILVDPLRVRRIMGWKISTYLIAEKYPQAVKYAEKVLASSPRNHPVKVLLIAALRETKAYDKAGVLLEKWIAEQRVKPDKTQSGDNGMPITPEQMIEEYQGLQAGLFVSAGKLDKADAYVAACIKNNAGNVRVRLGLVTALEEAKEYDKALKRLDGWTKALESADAATTRPDGSPIANALKLCRAAAIGVLSEAKRFDEVVKRADEYLKNDASNMLVLSWRSAALNELKKPDKALADIRKIHQMLSSLPLYKNNLGYQLADMGLELAEAERLIRQALAATDATKRDYVAPLDSLAWVLYKQGKFSDAARLFLQVVRRSRELDYVHPILFDHAGDGFYRLGWTEKAIELWSKALDTAAEDKTDSREVRKVKRDTPAKIKAAKAGKPAKVAPLGKGVTIESK